MAVVESLRRYLKSRFTYSSLSSQFLEGQQLFFGSVPWHYGIIIVLTGHLVAFLCPKVILDFNRAPARLYALEVFGLTCGLSCLVGLVSLAVRRASSARLRAVTTVMDIVLLAVLLTQVSLGVWIALTLRWGSNWFALALAPYLWSLVALKPDPALVLVLPLVVKLHVLGAFVLLALLPFSRLVHMLVVPWQYLWARPQQVIWNRDPRPQVGPGGLARR